jgi:hypothetical protein
MASGHWELHYILQNGPHLFQVDPQVTGHGRQTSVQPTVLPTPFLPAQGERLVDFLDGTAGQDQRVQTDSESDEAG